MQVTEINERVFLTLDDSALYTVEWAKGEPYLKPVKISEGEKGKKMSNEQMPSESDRRTENNVMRHEYRKLDEQEKAQMQAIKDKGLEMHELIASFGASRELSLAKTKVEEAVFWAVKDLTKGST